MQYPTLVYLKALAYSFKALATVLKRRGYSQKMADLPESYTTNAHFTEVTLSMPIWYT